VKDEEELEMLVVEGEVNVKTEKGIGSEKEECIVIENEEGMYSEEKGEEEDVDIKKEVSLEDTV
jgi:hypothetical protein